MVVLLNDIRSLHNVGSIFRTADGVGVEKVFLCGITPTPYDDFGTLRPQLAKVSLGAEASVPWEKCLRISTAITRLKKEGYTIVALEQAPNAVPYTSLHLPDFSRIAMIIGHEVDGVSPAVLRLADHVAYIPMHGKKESLNVSVAFGIAAYHYRALAIMV